MEMPAAMATDSKLKKPISRMTATYQLSWYPADQLWSSEADHPTPLCDTCEQQEYNVCHTTSVQLACTHCRAGKTECSYSPFHKACCVEMMRSGELPQAGSKNAVGKQAVVETCSLKQRGCTAGEMHRECPNVRASSGIARLGCVTKLSTATLNPTSHDHVGQGNGGEQIREKETLG